MVITRIQKFVASKTKQITHSLFIGRDITYTRNGVEMLDAKKGLCEILNLEHKPHNTTLSFQTIMQYDNKSYAREYLYSTENRFPMDGILNTNGITWRRLSVTSPYSFVKDKELYDALEETFQNEIKKIQNNFAY